MIESVVKEYAVLGNEYPKLMESGGGLIVLFKQKASGVVIQKDDHWEVGDRCNSFDMQQFTDFNGSVTLSNGSK